jgi:hypothetical protein
VAKVVATIGQLGPVDEPGDNPGIDIFTERLADLRFDTQLADHAVEGLRQPADLIARGNRHHGVERATLNRSSPMAMPKIFTPMLTPMPSSNRYKPGGALSAGRTETKPDYTYAT